MQSENEDDWQEEIFQKIRSMKELYLPHLNDIYQRATVNLQHQESLPQQQRSEKFEKLKLFKAILERLIEFLFVPKSNIMPALKDKVATCEKQIISVLNTQMRLPQSQKN